MTRDAQILREARQTAGLMERQMALILGVEEREVLAFEDGTEAPSPAVLDAYARAFGMTLGDFLAGDATSTVTTLLFRAMRDEPSLEQLAESGAFLCLGEFLRCVADTAALRRCLGEAATDPVGRLSEIAAPEAPVEANLHRQAEQLAGRVRARLKLGIAPIPSMAKVMKDVGVEVFWVTPDELDPEIDAASTVVPLPAVLVNLVGGSEQWWRTRMTLAHELCHLLFDRQVIFSPASSAGPGRVHLPPTLALQERRARAFAAHLLVPRAALEEILTDRVPTREDAVTAVCQHFQVGRVTALNQLRNIGRISESERHQMLARKPMTHLPPAHPDRDAAIPGLRAGVLRTLAVRALVQRKLSAVRARDYLGLDATEPLELGLNEGGNPTSEQLLPPRTPEERVRVLVQRRLLSNKTTASCVVGAVARDGGRWIVHVDEVAADGTRPRGHVVLGTDLQLVEDHLTPGVA